MRKRTIEGIKGIAFIGLALGYLFVYKTWGMDAYVYFGCGVVGFTGGLSLVAAALCPDSSFDD